MRPQKTYSDKPGDHQPKWWCLDVDGMRVGRVASQVATLLRGKHRPTFTPRVDSGDFVILLNAEKIQFSGNKLEDKKYYRHSGKTGSMKSRSARQQMDIDPTVVLEKAIAGMLPDNHLGREQIKRVKIYRGSTHNHSPQKPEDLKLAHRA